MVNAQLDASNKDKKIGNFRAYPQLSGLYMPDSITSYQAEGKTYILSANEGDGREYGIETTQSRCDELGFAWQEEDYRSTDAYSNKLGFCISHIDEVRGKKLKVDDKHPLAAALKDNKQLARLKFIKPNAKVAANDTLLTYGARSFSIWDEHGELVFDSGDQFGQIASMMEGENFNSSNDSNRSADDRSDDKGIEPEAVEVAKINGRTYAFIGLERQGVSWFMMSASHAMQCLSLTSTIVITLSPCVAKPTKTVNAPATSTTRWQVISGQNPFVTSNVRGNIFWRLAMKSAARPLCIA